MSLLSNLVQLSGLWWLLWEDKASQLSHLLWDTIFLPQLSQSNIHGTLEGFSSQSFTHSWAKFLALFIICARLEFQQRPELPLKETRWWSIVNWNTAFSLLSLCCTPLVTQSWCSHSPRTSWPCALFHTRSLPTWEWLLPLARIANEACNGKRGFAMFCGVAHKA